MLAEWRIPEERRSLYFRMYEPWNLTPEILDQQSANHAKDVRGCTSGVRQLRPKARLLDRFGLTRIIVSFHFSGIVIHLGGWGDCLKRRGVNPKP